MDSTGGIMEKEPITQASEKDAPRNLAEQPSKLHEETHVRGLARDHDQEPAAKNNLPSLKIVDSNEAIRPKGLASCIDLEHDVAPVSSVGRLVEVKSNGGAVSFGFNLGVINEKLAAKIKGEKNEQPGESEKKKQEEAKAKEIASAVKKYAEEIVRTGMVPMDMRGLWNVRENPAAVLMDKQINDALKALGSTMQIEVTEQMGPINSTIRYKVEVKDKGAVIDKDMMTLSYLHWDWRNPNDPRRAEMFKPGAR